MFCKKCGKQLPDGARFCSGCGTSLDAAPVVEPVVAVEEPPKKPGNKKLIIAIIALVVLIAVGVGVFILVDYLTEDSSYSSEDDEDKKKEAYDAAMALLEEGKYDEALAAFKEITDYSKSEKQVKKLEQWQADYDAAHELLAQQNYSGARDAFYALGDYRDSLEMAESGVSYAQYMDEYESYTDGYNLINTAELFKTMNGYKDSDEMVDKCYLKACESFLNGNDLSTAEYYSEYLSDEYKAEFQALLSEACADSQVLQILTEALEEWSTANTYALEYAVIEDALNKLLEYDGSVYSDYELEYYTECYVDALHDVLDVMEADGSIDNIADYYEATSNAMYYVEQLMQNCDLFADDDEMYNFYDGASEYYNANRQIELMLEDYLWGISVSPDESGNYYAYVYNYTGYSFDVDITLTYSMNDVLLDQQDTFTVTFYAYEDLNVYLPFPAEDFDGWYADWVFYNIQ